MQYYWIFPSGIEFMSKAKHFGLPLASSTTLNCSFPGDFIS